MGKGYDGINDGLINETLLKLNTVDYKNKDEIKKVKITIQKFIENINKVSTKTIDRLCAKGCSKK